MLMGHKTLILDFWSPGTNLESLKSTSGDERRQNVQSSCDVLFFFKLRNDELSSHITTVQRAAWQHFRQHWRLVAMHSNPSQGIGRFSSERLCYQRNTKLQEVSTELKNHWWATQWSEVCHWGSDSSWALNASWIATLVLAYQYW